LPLPLKLPPPDDGLEPGVQLGEVKGLHQVIFGPQLQAREPVVERGPRRDDEHARRRAIGFEGPEKVEVEAVGCPLLLAHRGDEEAFG
jgi:hypothetical protein